jgi:hypothetical protein
MKQFTWKSSLFLLTAVITLQGCKKGENDPFLSLRSRDARITGEWELIKMEKEEHTYYVPNKNPDIGYYELKLTSFDGKELTYNKNRYYNTTYGNPYNGYKDIAYTSSYSHILVIDKDGNIKETTIEDGKETGLTENWWWINDKKKKTRIAIGDDLNSYEIDLLKNNELILKQDHFNSSSNYPYADNSESYTATMTFKKN